MYISFYKAKFEDVFFIFNSKLWHHWNKGELPGTKHPLHNKQSMVAASFIWLWVLLNYDHEE